MTILLSFNLQSEQFSLGPSCGDVKKIRKERTDVGKVRKNRADVEKVRKNRADVEKVRKNRADVEKVQKNRADVEKVRKNRTDVEKVRKNRADVERIRRRNIEGIRKRRDAAEIIRKKRAERVIEEVARSSNSNNQEIIKILTSDLQSSVTEKDQSTKVYMGLVATKSVFMVSHKVRDEKVLD